VVHSRACDARRAISLIACNQFFLATSNRKTAPLCMQRTQNQHVIRRRCETIGLRSTSKGRRPI
jgi:hypothetical protein